MEQKNIDEARAELGAALAMALPLDEPAIIRHVIAAYLQLGGKLSDGVRERLSERVAEMGV